MTDTWSSYGLRLPKQMHLVAELPLPIDEGDFLASTRDHRVISNLNMEASSSLLAQMVKLHFMLIEVNNLNSQTVTGQLNEIETLAIVDSISKRLSDWYSAVPPYMRNTSENLNRYAAQGLGRMFVALYLGYYNYGQLLFYQFLDSERHSSQIQYPLYSAKCKANAIQLCEIVYTANTIPGCEIKYMMAGHVLAIASTVQIHTLLFGESDVEIQAAKSRLKRNYEILTYLKKYWSTLDITFKRFEEFHTLCQVSMDTSYRMDRRMLNFLLEFAKPLNEDDNNIKVGNSFHFGI